MITHHHYPLYLCGLAGLLFFTALGARDLWAPVEPRYAEIARVMFAKGEWVVPTVNGELYTDKPILYFWLVLLASKVAGSVNEWTLRLPAALAGLGLVLTTYSIGKDFSNPRVGFIAGAVLATSVRVIWEARWAHTDMVLALFTTLSLYFFARSLLKGHKSEILLAYAMMALATLTKGLIGVVLPALVVATYIVIRREWRLLTEARPFSGALVFLLVAAPWFVWVADATGGQWLKDFVYVHHLQRYTAGLGHRQPFYYYLTTFPVDFLPWAIFVVPALFTHRLRKRIIEEPVALFFTLWFVVIFLFFSISDTKRDLYLLPVFPVAALYVATYIDDLASGKAPQSPLYFFLTLVFFNLLWIGGLAVPVVAWYLQSEAFWISVAVAPVMVCGGALTVLFIRRRLPWNVFLSGTSTVVLITLSAALWILPFVNRYKSPRPFSLEVKQRVPVAASLYVFADSMHDFNFYMQREVIPIISSLTELYALLATNQEGYLLIKERDLKKINAGGGTEVLITKSIGGKNWHLVSVVSPASGSNP